jgi:hypothetical protein
MLGTRGVALRRSVRPRGLATPGSARVGELAGEELPQLVRRGTETAERRGDGLGVGAKQRQQEVLDAEMARIPNKSLPKRLLEHGSGGGSTGRRRGVVAGSGSPP